jgi:hypothetical protein
MVARLVGLMHGDALKIREEAMRTQYAIRFLTPQIHPGFHTRQVPCGRQCFAGVQEASEPRLGGGAWQHCTKLDVALPMAGLGSRATVTNRKADEFLILPKQDRVTKRLCVHRTDFPLYIEPRVEGLGYRAAST